MTAGRPRRFHWNTRWATRTAIALTPIGALAALLAVGYATRQITEALVAYGLGALAGGAVGFVLGGAAGAMRPQRPRQRRSELSPAEWVLQAPSAAERASVPH